MANASAGPSRHIRAVPPLFCILSTYSPACCLATSSDCPVPIHNNIGCLLVSWSARNALRRDVDVLPLRVQNGMLAKTEHMRLGQHVAVARDIEPPRSVRLDQPRHVVIDPIALGRGRHPNRLFVELVILRNFRTRGVVLPD